MYLLRQEIPFGVFVCVSFVLNFQVTIQNHQNDVHFNMKMVSHFSLLNNHKHVLLKPLNGNMQPHIAILTTPQPQKADKSEVTDEA